MPLPHRVLEEATRIVKDLEAAVATIGEARLREAALHYPQAGGKALRPALAILSHEAAGGEPGGADPLAISVELLHTFSLVHDDLMDHDDVRRGVPAVHRAFDEATAILAGDALYALAFEQLGGLGDHPAAGRVLQDVAATARTLCEGQSMDMAFETRWPTVDEYETMIARKTAALFACATGTAARLATEDPATIQALDRFGHASGMAFQLQDDVLDLTGSTDALGKPSASDVRAGKKTHPLLVAREASMPRDREHLDYVLTHEATEEDLAWVLDLLEEHGAIQASQARAEAFFGQAEEALTELPETDARDALAGTLSWVRQRGH